MSDRTAIKQNISHMRNAKSLNIEAMMALEEAEMAERGDMFDLLDSLNHRSQLRPFCACGAEHPELVTVVHPAVLRYLLAYIDSIEEAEMHLAAHPFKGDTK